jgi:hypothetical protein
MHFFTRDPKQSQWLYADLVDIFWLSIMDTDKLSMA